MMSSPFTLIITFLLQAELSFASLVIIIVLLHEGLIYWHQLPGDLSVVLVDGQPAGAREVVPVSVSG